MSGITVRYQFGSLAELAEHLEGTAKDLQEQADKNEHAPGGTKGYRRELRAQATGLEIAARIVAGTTLLASPKHPWIFDPRYGDRHVEITDGLCSFAVHQSFDGSINKKRVRHPDSGHILSPDEARQYAEWIVQALNAAPGAPELRDHPGLEYHQQGEQA
jgi:hypothetical protein